MKQHIKMKKLTHLITLLMCIVMFLTLVSTKVAATSLHQHSDSCYTQVLNCKKTEHSHSDDCKSIICENMEHNHEHNSDCYSVTCQENEYSHSDECNSQTLTCEIETVEQKEIVKSTKNLVNNTLKNEKSNSTVDVYSETDISSVLKSAINGDEIKFVFQNDMTLSNGIEIPIGVSVILENKDGSNITIKRQQDMIPADPLMNVNGTLTIKQAKSGSLVFDGENYDFIIGSMFLINGSLIVESGSIINAKAQNGGAIQGTSGSNINIKKGQFLNNSANGLGGAIYTEGSLIISDGFFSSNIGSSGGGAVEFKAANEEDKIFITGGKFTDNKTGPFGMFGGAIRIDSGKGKIVGGTFTNNSALVLGGAIYIHEGSVIEMNRVLVYNNEGTAEGGGIFNCPIGGGDYRRYCGLTLYNNKVENIKDGACADDFFSEMKQGTELHNVYLSNYTLNGSQIEYYKDVADNRYNGTGNPAPLSYYQNTVEKIELKSGATQDDFEESEKLANVFIYNNKAMSGAGIANNGILTIGYDTELKIQKKVLDGSINADDIFKFKITLQDKDKKLYNGVITCMTDGVETQLNFVNGIATIELHDGESVSLFDIPTGFTYKVEEIPTDGYSLSSSSGTTGTIEFEKQHVASFVNEITKPAEETVTVEGNKTWDDNNNEAKQRPSSITINLLADGTIIDTKKVTADDNWSWKFINLSKYKDGKEIVYSVSENQIPGYKGIVNGYNVTNTYVGVDTPIYDYLTVNKQWDDDYYDNRPLSVTVQLLRDGKLYGEPVILSKENNWTNTFKQLDNSYTWTIDELFVPEGYTKTIEHNGKEWTIINSYKDQIDIENNKNDSVKTEDSTYIIFWIILTCISASCVMIYLLRKRKQ